MALLPGFSIGSPAGGVNNPYVTDDIDLFEDQPWPFGPSLAGAAPIQDVTSHLPVSAVPRLLEGFIAYSYQHDFYHRIHISRSQLDLGNVVSTQITPVNVWNAYLVDRTLVEISGLDEGIELAGQPEPPFVFEPLQEREWLVSVTPNGVPVLDTALEWQFDNGATARLRITANRIIAWTFVPDWGDGVRERLIFATDILQSESGVSQRRKLRLAPRREFQASMFGEGRERQLLDLALAGWGDRLWALPIWPDVQLLAVGVPADGVFIPCQTEHLDFRAGGLALLRGEDAFTYETVEVEGVSPLGLDLARATQKAWPAGTRLYPARTAQLIEPPPLTKLTDQLIEAQVRFLIMEACEWPALMPASTYRGLPVWDRRPDDSQDLTLAAERLMSTLDSGLGLPRFTDTARRAFALLGQRWLDQGRAERAALRSFIYAMCGRQKVVWVPTHMADLTLVATVSSVAATIDVANIGYARFSGGRPGRRDIRIELYGGAVFFRRVLAATEVDTDVEQLVLDAALGQVVEPDQVARISWMVLCRFESDTQELEHMTDSLGVASWATTFREERDDEF